MTNIRDKSTKPCPKCGALPMVGAKECDSCGLVFKKWEDKSLGGSVYGAERLEKMWQLVLTEWENPLYHDNFVQQCGAENNLTFASLKYRRILDADPHNQEALARKEQIMHLVMTTFMMEPSSKELGQKHSSAVTILKVIGFLMILLGVMTPPDFKDVGRPFVVLGLFCVGFAFWVGRLRD